MKTEAQLGAIFVAAMKIWDAQKAEGVPLTDRVAGLAKTLRAAWPFTREWKYLCTSCGDLGLVLEECPGDGRCGSRWGERVHPAHQYGTACWCAAGRKFRPKGKPTDEDAVTAAATIRKPTRFGR
jgi:hypothetical protein